MSFSVRLGPSWLKYDVYDPDAPPPALLPGETWHPVVVEWADGPTVSQVEACYPDVDDRPGAATTWKRHITMLGFTAAFLSLGAGASEAEALELAEQTLHPEALANDRVTDDVITTLATIVGHWNVAETRRRRDGTEPSDPEARNRRLHDVMALRDDPLAMTTLCRLVEDAAGELDIDAAILASQALSGP